MQGILRRSFTGLCLALMLAAAPWPLFAAQHIIDISEIYSNEDGSIQFVELIAFDDDQTSLAPTGLSYQEADGSPSPPMLLEGFGMSVPAFTAGKTLLIATFTFEEETGLKPDFTFPDGFLFPLISGRIILEHEGVPCIPEVPDCEIDAVAYGDFTGDNGRFDKPTPHLPSNGCALVRTHIGTYNTADPTIEDDDNARDFEVGVATPTNLAGETWSIPIECPGSPPLSMQIDEIYSKGDAYQYIELFNEATGETNFESVELVAWSADGSTETVILEFDGEIPGLADGGRIFVGTEGFGITPDFLLAEGAIPADGRIALRHVVPCPDTLIDCEIDAVAYGAFTGDNGEFGTPAPALSEKPCLALVRLSTDDDNSVAFVEAVGTPQNNAGDELFLECQDPPVADFSATPLAGSPPLEVTFTDLTTNEPQAFEWDFGDGGTSTEQNPTHIYDDEGTYDVSLAVVNWGGEDTIVKKAYITVTADAPFFKRGNADGNSTTVALIDAIFILKYQFKDGPVPPCMDAVDMTNNGAYGGIGEALYLLTWAYVGGATPASPGPFDCGPDPAGTSLGCETPPASCN